MKDRETGWSEVESLLDSALDQPEPDREDFIRQRAGAAQTGAEALALLRAIDASAGFLEPDESRTASDMPLPKGERLGPWRVEALIGRGGMGDVYRVQRADGLYQQQAALKVMKGLSPDGAALFDRERQVLARLEHPGIARLLDGGLSADGRPWMVMEFASGSPVDVWARRASPSPRRIVELGLEVCDALSHAHRKLTVHRDIKPSNILVDANGRARVIDFGVARLVGGDDSETMPLSLEFAAPELLEGGAASTASDVYGLGATLYALLAGRPPLDLSADPLPVAVRRAVEEAPGPLPAEARSGSDQSLLRDLDAILARALAKKPEDRYRTMEALCEDLQSALDGKAVFARRGERGYALGRFLARHRWQTAALAAVVLSLAAGLTASLWQASEARIERDWALQEQARLEAVQHYLYFMLRDGADASGGTAASAGEILEAAAEQVSDMFSADTEQGGQVMHTLAELYFYLNDYEAAAPLLRRLVATDDLDPVLLASARYDLAQVLLRMGSPDEAEPLLAQAQAFWAGDDRQWRRRLVDSRLVEARLLRDRGRLPEAVGLLESTLPEKIALSGESARMTGVFHNDLGVMLIAAGRMEEAGAQLREALAVWRTAGLDDSPDALNTLNNLAAAEALTGNHAAAEPLFREILDLRLSAYGPSATTAAVLNNYGKTLINLGRPGEALPYLRQAVAMAREHAGITSLTYAAAVAGHSEAKAGAGDAPEALRIGWDGYDEVAEAAGGTGPGTAIIAVALARTLAQEGETGRAAELLDEAEAAFEPLGAAAGPQLQAIETIRSRHGI